MTTNELIEKLEMLRKNHRIRLADIAEREKRAMVIGEELVGLELGETGDFYGQPLPELLRQQIHEQRSDSLTSASQAALIAFKEWLNS